jgi:hypothetical protein
MGAYEPRPSIAEPSKNSGLSCWCARRLDGWSCTGDQPGAPGYAVPTAADETHKMLAEFTKSFSDALELSDPGGLKRYLKN